jgi:single-strand DNA-binding protein
MVNLAIILGNVGQAPELRKTENGSSVTNFSVATNENWTGKDGQKQQRTEWHYIQVWGKLAEICAQYVKKGSKVYVEGKIQTRSWEKDGQKHYKTEINASTVQFLDSRGDPNANGNSDHGGGGVAPGQAGGSSGVPNDL